MKISVKGIHLIKEFEGLRLRAYQCPANIWTIGYGHTRNVKPSDILTQAEADVLLLHDIEKAEEVVRKVVQVPLTQGQFDSLVSFVFNLGAGNFLSSTLLKKLNAGLYQDAAEQLMRWVKSGDTTLEGLVRRRKAEQMLFLHTE